MNDNFGYFGSDQKRLIRLSEKKRSDLILRASLLLIAGNPLQAYYAMEYKNVEVGVLVAVS